MAQLKRLLVGLSSKEKPEMSNSSDETCASTVKSSSACPWSIHVTNTLGYTSAISKKHLLSHGEEKTITIFSTLISYILLFSLYNNNNNSLKKKIVHHIYFEISLIIRRAFQRRQTYIIVWISQKILIDCITLSLCCRLFFLYFDSVDYKLRLRLNELC